MKPMVGKWESDLIGFARYLGLGTPLGIPETDRRRNQILAAGKAFVPDPGDGPLGEGAPGSPEGVARRGPWGGTAGE